jgi:hypothetical protein
MRMEEKKQEEDVRQDMGLFKGNAFEAIKNFYTNFGVANDAGQAYPVFSSKLSVLDKYGASLRVYFSFMKSMGLIFLFVGILSGCNCYINILGNFLDNSTAKSNLDYMTVGNFYGYVNNTNHADLNDDMEDGERRLSWTTYSLYLKIIYIFNDFAMTCILFIFLFWFKVRAKLLEKKLNRKNIMTKEYAIEIKGFPSRAEMGAPTEREIA